jgi:hypothetical protein
MTVDPKEDVDICITCISKKPPKLPLREELPSLGVELIYTARGTGAKVSENEGRRKARDFRHKEEMKELKKRRLFPKSSKRIKEQLEERRRQIHELKLPSAFSYESYQSELYGDWVTDSSSSSQSRSEATSSDSSLSEIRTVRNRRMTKNALKRWRLFRKQSTKRNSKRGSQEDDPKKRPFKSHSSMGSLFGEDIFLDFLAPLSMIEDDDAQEAASSPTSKQASPASEVEIVSPSSPGRASSPRKDRLRNPSPVTPDVTPSWMRQATSTTPKSGDRVSSTSPGRAGADDTPSWIRQATSTSPKSGDNISETSPERGSHSNTKSPTWEKRVGVTSPTSGLFTAATQAVSPSTMVSSPGRSEGQSPGRSPGQSLATCNSPEAASDVSSITGSGMASTRREKLFGGSSKIARYLSLRKNRQTVTSKPPETDIREAPSNDSNSDTSLIGLSVAFPNDEVAADLVANVSVDRILLGGQGEDIEEEDGSESAANVTVDRQFFVGKVADIEEEEDSEADPYMSEDSIALPEEVDAAQPAGDLSGIFDGGQMSASGETKSSSFQNTSASGTGYTLAEPSESSPLTTVERPGASPTQMLEDLPADLYQAFGRLFGRNPTVESKETALVPVTTQPSSASPVETKQTALVPAVAQANSTALVPVGHSPSSLSGAEIIPYRPIVPGIDVGEEPGSLPEWVIERSSLASTFDAFVKPMAVEGLKVVSDELEGALALHIDKSTAQAFSDIPGSAYGRGLPATNQELTIYQKSLKKGDSFEDALKQKQIRLTHHETDINTMMDIISEDPTLVQLKEQDGGQMVLHQFASSPFLPPLDCEGFLDMLVEDIQTYQTKLEVVYGAFPAASEVVDRDGDLPVHVLARNLMQWEVTWYEKVFEHASKEQEKGGSATVAIKKLYYSMSLCIETLLRRIVADSELCRVRGSVGTLIPLHIATIFTAPVRSLRLALESYPTGAREACSVMGIDSFVPDGALPMELHDSFSTDFPKWEVEMQGYSDLKWSRPKNEEKSCVDDIIRRSDLLFAYNPSIKRFWKDRDRIRRTESRIRYEAKQLAENRQGVSKSSELLWIWMCTFHGTQGPHAVFASSVERILEGLPLSLVKLLASIKTSDGDPIIDVAHPDCVAVFRTTLDSLTESIVPITTTSESSKTESKVLRSWEDSQTARLSQSEALNLGQVCRSIFNIREKKIPTSFVILPYKLARNSNGTLGMSSAESAATAIKFADCLLKLTDPRSVLYFVDKKSVSYFGVSIYDESADAALRDKAFSHIAGFERALLDLYTPGMAYLYLLDEETGVPLVPRSDDIYPMVLNEPANMVRKLLPMMIPGMIQMRGDKALSVLSSVLLDDSVSIVPTHYEEAINKLKGYMQSNPPISDSNVEEVTSIKRDASRFLSTATQKKCRSEETMTGTTEWNVELSILRVLFGVNDPKNVFSGLKKEETDGGDTRWIYDESVDENTPVRRKYEPQVSIYADKQVKAKYGSESSESGKGSYETLDTQLREAPLKFHQPPDDCTVSTFETQASPNIADNHAISKEFQMDSNLGFSPSSEVVDVALLPSQSIDSTESGRIQSKFFLLTDSFTVGEGECKDCIDDCTSRDIPTIWNPAEQVWVDVNNRLDVTGFFWDAAEVTSLRVGLVQQANKLCLLRRRIEAMKHEETKRTSQVDELYCKMLGDRANILEIPSPRTRLGIRRLLHRMNDLEYRLLEGEVGAQLLDMRGMALLHEIVALTPSIDELESMDEDSLKSGSELYSFDTTDSSGTRGSDECSAMESSDLNGCSEVVAVSRTSASNVISSSRELSYGSNNATVSQGSDSRDVSDFTVSQASGSRGTSSRRELSDVTVAKTSESKETSDPRDLSSMTISKASEHNQATSQASRRPIPDSSSRFPMEIALPALDHSESSVGDDSQSNLKASSAFYEDSSSSSSASFENTSVVKYDKTTGLIEC